MRLLGWLMVIAVTVAGFTACQKELEGDGIAIGSLKEDAAGNCSPVTINGIYRTDSLMKAENYVDVQVNIVQAGTFEIKSDTINGYSFSKSGTVGTGLNTIRLFASGKPLTAGTNTFTIIFGSSTCTFDITVFGVAPGAAVYTLGGAPGNCAAFTVNGTYTAGIPTDASNWVNFSVDVTSIGTYNLSTTTVNGITFSGTGVFTTTGTQGITLSASGTPTAGGTSTFTPNNAGSSCSFAITVLPAGSGTAVYSLEGNPGSCSGAIVNGTYTAGTPVTAANTVALKVNVSSLGSYSISTTTANGISFSGTGTFTATGVQTILLTAPGTPATAGTFNHTATAPGTPGTSCTFSVTSSGTTPPPTNLDYLPQTPFSNWSAKLVGGGPGDTTYVKASTDTKTFLGQVYRIFETLDTGTPTDSIYQRKSGSIYYQFLDGTFGVLDNPINKEIKLLDSSLNAGATWTDNLGANSAGGVPLTSTKITAEILVKGVSATVAGNTYDRVIKVKYTYLANIGIGDIVFAEEERWYAKGFGLIYDNLTINVPTPSTQEFQTTRIAIF